MTTVERIREAVSIRERLLLVLSRRQETRKPAGGGFGDRGGGQRGMGGGGGGGRGMGGRGAAGGAGPGRGFSNRIGGFGSTAPKSDSAGEPQPAQPPPVSKAQPPKPTLDPDVAEALGVGAVVVARLAESFERVTDVAKARAILEAIPRLVPTSAAHLPIAAAIREVVVPLLGGRFADAADDRVAVLRLLGSEISYLLSKAPERAPFDDPRRGEPPRGGRRPDGRGRERDGGRERGRDGRGA